MAALSGKSEGLSNDVAPPASLKIENKDQQVHITSGMIFREEVSPTLAMETELLKMTFRTQSPFQLIQVIETADFGKTLVLDGKTQSTQLDEFAYHESLVQPAMLLCGWGLGSMEAWRAHRPRRVYIGGGGELATARELLRHPSVEEVVMVDLDAAVVAASRAHLPEWGAGAFEDPRLSLSCEDAYAWLARDDASTGLFDVIVMDICDPTEAGPGIKLYTKEFYELASAKLRPGGVLVTQSGPAGLVGHTECFTTIHNTLERVFEHVLPFGTEVPSFGSVWGFNVAFNGNKGTAGQTGAAFADLNAAEVDAELVARLGPAASEALRHYDGACHRGLFGLGKHVRAALAAEDRVITEATPVFMH